MQLRFTRAAGRDLVRLREFIARHDPAAAARVSRRLRRGIDLLVQQPALGIAVGDLADVRQFVVGDFVIRYCLRDDAVVILRIWHGREARPA